MGETFTDNKQVELNFPCNIIGGKYIIINAIDAR